jgi:cell division protein FtsB
MPAAEPPRQQPVDGSADPAERQRGRVSAVPSFLREAARPRATLPSASAARPPTLPRPATPRAPAAEPAPGRLDPAALPMPTLSRRRVVTAAGILVASLLAVGFLRQVGEATAASARAAELRAANAALEAEVAQLQDDLTHVQDPRYIELSGRAFGLGARGEMPFALAAGAPELAADAPGSAAVRLGAEPLGQSPLDAWLDVLFGSG